jgi:hypothetical protein
MLQINLTIKGLQEAQDRNLRLIAAMQPEGALGRAVQYATVEGFRYLTSVVHVDTGAYKAANRMALQAGAGRIYVDPGAHNPRTRRPVVEYAPQEEARGGEHAAYARTLALMQSEILGRAVDYFRGQLP